MAEAARRSWAACVAADADIVVKVDVIYRADLPDLLRRAHRHDVRAMHGLGAVAAMIKAQPGRPPRGCLLCLAPMTIGDLAAVILAAPEEPRAPRSVVHVVCTACASRLGEPGVLGAVKRWYFTQFPDGRDATPNAPASERTQ